MQDDSRPQPVSPDGTIRVEFDVQTGRMSHEIYSPRVVSVADGEVLVDLWGTQWDASAQFEQAGTVRLSLRHYDGEKPGFALTIDARARTFSFADAPGEAHPLARFEKLIGRKHAAQERYVQSRPVAPPTGKLKLLLYALLLAGIVFVLLNVFGVKLFN
ncbi:MAG: hypothetical protein QOE47_9 [Pyrinomonadaceae bacterium]|jgi:hypothetical protein|nr:hypothetical protein [Pyrinomonadaceae bacterium]